MEGKTIGKYCYRTVVDLFADRTYNEVGLGVNTDAVCSAKIDLWLDFPCDVANFQDITGLIIYYIFVDFDFSCITVSLTECFDKSSFKLTVEQSIDGNIAELRYLLNIVLA